MMTGIIFDSLPMHELRRKEAQRIYERTPYILYLANNDTLSSERDYLEYLLQLVQAEKQKKWIADFVNQDDKQHLSAWFEMMLFGWLINAGTVDVEPEIKGNYPDFVLRVAGQPIVIEARAVLKSEKERIIDEAFHAIGENLKKIELPFEIKIKAMSISSIRGLNSLTPSVTGWLRDHTDEVLKYEDQYGNRIIFQAEKKEYLTHVEVFYVPRANWINPDQLKPALQEKAKQHVALRELGYPYVIALFLENSLFSTEEVFEAWVGKIVYTLDSKMKKIVNTYNDQSGLSFHRQKVQKQSVSGILVFHAERNEQLKSRYLDGYYLENPFAENKFDWKIFPVKSGLIADKQAGKMVWQER